MPDTDMRLRRSHVREELTLDLVYGNGGDASRKNQGTRKVFCLTALTAGVSANPSI